MIRIPFDDFTHLVSGYLLLYCGRTLADLPPTIMGWILWAWVRGMAAQQAADVLSQVRWPSRATLDADPLVPTKRKEVQARLKRQIA